MNIANSAASANAPCLVRSEVPDLSITAVLDFALRLLHDFEDWQARMS